MRFYCEVHLAARPDARPLLQGARHDMATKRPGGVGWAAEPKASGSSPPKALGVGGFLAARDFPPEPQPGDLPCGGAQAPVIQERREAMIASKSCSRRPPTRRPTVP